MKLVTNTILMLGFTGAPWVLTAQAETPKLEEVIVSASLFGNNTENLNRPANVLSGDKLQNAAAATLGDTLKNELGVNSSSFGPGVGLPVIRGQSDNRIKVMQDSVGSMDASAASPDHAISLEPLLASKIEVLRGPAALRYGSGAIGGVVNVVDNRIPTALPDDQWSGGGEIRYGDNNDETVGVIKLDGGADAFAVHIDGVKRDSGDMHIPGASAANESENSSRGFVANTGAEANSATLGGSFIGDRGFIGLSVNTLDNNYGVPPEGDEWVRIDMQQTRYDLKGELSEPVAGLEKISLRLGRNDYEHTEIEDGTAGTRFTNEALEGRLELFHLPAQFSGAQWRGAGGLQVATSTFAALGEEAFIPRSDIKNLGIFIAEEITLGTWRYELGARGDRQSINPDNGGDLTHNSLNLSASGSWHFADHQQISLIIARSQRAPSVEELLADGPHPATGSYLTGDQGLQSETSVNSELAHHWHNAKLRTSCNIFRNEIADFIYAKNLNLQVEDFTAHQYVQEDAVFTGVEGEINYAVLNNWDLRVFGDLVRARTTAGEDLPRIPPARLGGALDYHQGSWRGGVSFVHTTEQDDPGLFEAVTARSTRLDANASYQFSAVGHANTVFIKIHNVFDAEIRNATSYLREITPEAGRNVQVGLRSEW